MAPPRRISRRQLEILMDFLEENKDMTNGLLPGTPVSHKLCIQKWSALAKKLNAVEAGPTKTPGGWKKYWFEWRHKCRKKAADARRFQSTSDGTVNRFAPLNDLEVRVLNLSGGGTTTQKVSASEQHENSLGDDSDSEPLERIKAQSTPSSGCVRQSIAHSSKVATDDDCRASSPPPRWALDLEERKIAAEERMAGALESIASAMRSQEERRAMLDERMADALTALAGTVQDLNSGVHEALQHLRHNPFQPNGTDSKDNIYY